MQRGFTGLCKRAGGRAPRARCGYASARGRRLGGPDRGPGLRVLVVGCGCTGSLFAKHFRARLRAEAHALHRLPRWARSARANLEGRVHLTMWDWARGPAGRMAAYYARAADGGPWHVADLGAQCLSARSPADEEALRALGAVDAFGLAARTGQRPRDASHFWVPGGLAQLLGAQIRDGEPDAVAFRRRVLGLERDRSGWLVEAEVGAPPHWLAGGHFQTGRYSPEPGQAVTTERFDAVVLAVTATDALHQIHGVRSAIGPGGSAALETVGYDTRLSVALLLSAALRARVDSLFADGLSEVDLEHSSQCAHGVLGLLAWQDRKLRDSSDATLLVAHSSRQFASSNLAAARAARSTPEEFGLRPVLDALAARLGVRPRALREAVLDRKAIHWHQAQARRCMPGGAPCLVASGGRPSQPMLVLCGDYFVEASFAGSSRSAGAAADAVIGWARARLVA